jgi:DNA polymerase-3 subunit delta'
MSESQKPGPRDTAQLLGHEAAEQALLDAMHSGRMAHAWLFTGPRGIGKASLAYRLARHLFVHGKAEDAGPSLFGAPLPASRPKDLFVAPEDPVFKRVAGGGHADLRTIEIGADPKTGKKRGEIVAADVRALGEFLSLTPAEGGWRVVIIDAADDMNRHAANAVLKVLEEPPARAILILVSHSPGRLLPTIRSRCRVLALKPLPPDAMTSALAERHPQMEADERATLAALSEGSLGRADQLVELGGVAVYRAMIGILTRLPDLDVTQVHRFVSDVAGEGFDLTADMLRAWHARLVLGIATGQWSEEIVPGEGALFRRLARPAALERWFELWDKNGRLLRQADGLNLDHRQVLLSAFLSLEGAARA